MADTLGTLVVRIAADIKELESGLNQAGEKTRTTAASMQASLGGVSQAMVDAQNKAMTLTKSQIDAANATAGSKIATVELSNEMQRLLARYDPLGAKMRSLQSDYAALEKAMDAGNSKSGMGDAFDKTLAGLNADMDKTASLMKAAGVAGADGFGKAAGAADKSAFATAQAKRELMVLGHEALTGNFSRMPGSFMVLAERMSLTESLMNPMTLGLIGIGIAAVGVAVEMAKGAAEQKAMDNALILTGNYAGLTSDSLDALAHTATATGGSIGDAKKAVTELAASGKYTGDQIGVITTAAIAMEHATGKSVEATIKEFESLAVQAGGHSATMSDEISKATLKLDDQYHFLTLAVYDQIRALEKEGDMKGAAALATNEFAKVTQARAAEIVADVGTIGKAWNSVKEYIGGATDAVMNWGKTATAAGNVARLEAEMANLRVSRSTLPGKDADLSRASTDAKLANDADQLIVAKKELFRVNERAADQQAVALNNQREVNAANAVDVMLKAAQAHGEDALTAAKKKYHAELDALPPSDPRNDPDTVRKGEEALTKQYGEKVKALKNVHEALTVYDRLMRSISEKTALQQLDLQTEGALSAGQKVALKIMDDLRTGTLKLTDAEKINLTGKLEYMLAVEHSNLVVNAGAKATEQASKERQSELDTIGKSTATLQDQIRAQQDHNAGIGQTAEAIAALTAQRELDKASTLQGIAIKELDRNLDYQKYDATMAEVAAMRTLAAEKARGGALETADKGAKDLLAAQKKAAEESGKYWEDALMRAFESGKGFFQGLWDTIKNTLKTSVLKLLIQPVTGVITGMGLSGSAMAAEQGGTGALGMVGALKSGYDLIANGVSNSIAKGFTSLAGTSFGQSIGLSNSSAIAGNNPSAYTPAGGQLTELGTTSMAALTAVGNGLAAYGIEKAISGGYQTNNHGIVDAAVLVGSYFIGPLAGVIGGLFNRAFGTSFDHAGISGSFGGSAGFSGSNYTKYDGGWFRSDSTNTTAMDANAQRMLADQYRTLQVNTGLQSQTLGLKNLGSMSGVTSNFDLNVSELSAGKTAEQASAAIDKALQDEFAKVADKLATAVAPGLDKFAKSGETASATLSRLSSALLTTNAMFDALGVRLLDASLAGGNAASSLADAFGGLDGLKSSLGSFYDSFYTDVQKTSTLTRQTSESFANLGITMPALDAGTRDWYKSLVVSQLALDQTSPATASATAALLNLQGAVNTLAPTFDSAATSAKADADAAIKHAQDIASERKGLQDQLDNLTMSNVQLLDKQRFALDWSNQSLFDQVQAATDAKTQTDALTAATTALAATNKGLQDQLDILTGKETAHAIALRDATDVTTAVLLAQVDAQTKLNDATTQAASDAKALKDALTSAGGGLASFIAGLKLNGATTPAMLAQTRATYNADLTLAQAGNVDASNRLPSSGKAYLDAQNVLAASTVDMQRAAALMAAQLSALPATQSYEQKMLDAVNATTQSVTDLNGKLVTELTVSARSEIVKAISVIGTSTLSDEMKRLALLDTETIAHKIDLIAGMDLSTDFKKLALDKAADFARIINLTVGSDLTDAQKMLALGTATSDFNRTINALGGLTEDQKLLLNGQTDYSKTILISTVVASSGAAVSSATDVPATTTATTKGWTYSEPQRNAAASAYMALMYADAAALGTNYLGLEGRMSEWPTLIGQKDADALNSYKNIFSAYSFAVGTNAVPYDMTANIHKDERIIPAADNRELMERLRSPQGNSAALVAEIRSLRAEVQALRESNTRENSAIATHTANTADSTRRMDVQGVLVYTDPAEPIATKAAA